MSSTPRFHPSIHPFLYSTVVQVSAPACQPASQPGKEGRKPANCKRSQSLRDSPLGHRRFVSRSEQNSEFARTNSKRGWRRALSRFVSWRSGGGDGAAAERATASGAVQSVRARLRKSCVRGPPVARCSAPGASVEVILPIRLPARQPRGPLRSRLRFLEGLVGPNLRALSWGNGLKENWMDVVMCIIKEGWVGGWMDEYGVM